MELPSNPSRRLRLPFLIGAWILMVMAFSIDAGTPALQSFASAGQSPTQVRALLEPQLDRTDLSQEEKDEALSSAISRASQPPGRAVVALSLLDGLLMLSITLVLLGSVVPGALHARYQGVVTLLVSMGVLGKGLMAMTEALAAMLVMVTLLLSFPFGTIAYLVKWGSFPVGQAGLLLGLSAFFRLLGLGALVLAHQRFLQNKGLLLLVLTAMLGSSIIGVFHGWVPSVVVSISDAAATIVVAVLVLIWSIVLLVGALLSLPKLLG